ncbi:hypothetical protein JF66_11435 [Cryobacterium sp. MLB-32]|nr:hypothetical protein JF66_11435 [Cryobacterium sp. MLB-32]
MGASTLLLTACQAAPEQSATPPASTAVGPHPVDTLLATGPVYIAHRGSSDNWVEHTMDAYAHAIAFGAAAIEVSVSASSDDVFLCHHDATTERMTGQDLVIAQTTWKELSTLHNDAREWLGPASALQPISRLDTVLDAFAPKHLMFIEDKQGESPEELFDLMEAHADPTHHFVWKQAVEYPLPARIGTAGYKAWGYFTKDTYARAEEYGGRFDYLGVEHSATDEEIATVIALGKPVIAWPIHYRFMRDRMLRLGVTGMMCSNVPYVSSSTPTATTDAFATGLRAPGDLPWSMDMGSEVQPLITPETASIAISMRGTQSYLMGSMCPVPADSYTLTWEMRWAAELPPGPTDTAGVAFGLPDDQPFRVGVAGETAGYYATVRRNGTLELFSRAGGSEAGVSLGAVATASVRPGEWMRFQVAVSPAGIRLSRADGRGWSIDSADASSRGQYFWLCKNYPAGPGVEFRAVSIT